MASAEERKGRQTSVHHNPDDNGVRTLQEVFGDTILAVS
jgi:hypothetical protein